MASRSTIVDVTYHDLRTGERVCERRIQEVPYEELDDVRSRELALVKPPRDWVEERYRNTSDRRDDVYAARRSERDYKVDRTVQRRVRERISDDDYDRSRRARHDSDHDVVTRNRSNAGRRRGQSAYDSESESDSSQKRRRRQRKQRRARSERGDTTGNEDGGRCFYSEKSRRDANFAERHLDSSYDGLLAAAAGAALGAITARRFGGEEKKGWKTVGGAILGAAAVNVAENHWRIYTEEKEERREDHWEAEQPLECGVKMAEVL